MRLNGSRPSFEEGEKRGSRRKKRRWQVIVSSPFVT